MGGVVRVGGVACNLLLSSAPAGLMLRGNKWSIVYNGDLSIAIQAQEKCAPNCQL